MTTAVARRYWKCTQPTAELCKGTRQWTSWEMLSTELGEKKKRWRSLRKNWSLLELLRASTWVDLETELPSSANKWSLQVVLQEGKLGSIAVWAQAWCPEGQSNAFQKALLSLGTKMQEKRSHLKVWEENLAKDITHKITQSTRDQGEWSYSHIHHDNLGRSSAFSLWRAETLFCFKGKPSKLKL